MLLPWLDEATVAERLRWAGAITGLDLAGLGTTGTEDDIRDTATAQPLLVALAIAVAGALIADNPVAGDLGGYGAPGVLAGHSVGEYAAAALAGVLSPETALTLVRERGRLMAEASARTPTGMSAVLGGDAEEVIKALDALGLTPANVNGAGQVVAAGSLDALAALADTPPAGARVRALHVAGAFHTHYMQTARDGLAHIAAAAPARDPRHTFVSNADGAVVSSGAAILDRLVDQVAAPVRWDMCMQTLGELGVTAVIELPPAGTLTGLVRRAMPGVETLAIKSPADLSAARALLERHVVPASEPAPPWRLAVAPVAGTFHVIDLELGSPVAAGDALGTVTSNRSEAAVAAVHGGVLVEWLVHDGDPVSPGQAIAVLHPDPVLA